MTELSIFIDESGDFGPYEKHAPFYLIALVFHNQDHDIENRITHLRKHVEEAGFPAEHAIHTAPLIRREKDYSSLGMTERRKLFRSLFNFMRLCDIRYKTFMFKKKEFADHDRLVSRISRDIGLFVRDNLNFFQSFDKLIVYYDNGQKEITNIINTIFNVFLEADVRKVEPSGYCLFQAADMLCTLRLISEKADTVGLSKSELEFFHSVRELRKNYLKPVRQKRLMR